MDTLTQLLSDLFGNIWNQVQHFIVHHGPAVVLSLVVLILGWLIAVIVRQVSHKLLRSIGFNIFCEKFGLKALLQRGGVDSHPSYLVGLFFYWVILISALAVVFSTLELVEAHAFLLTILWFLPKIAVAAILLSVGILFGNYVGQVAEKTLRMADVPLSGLLGQLARFTIIGLAVLNVVQYLELAAPIVFQVLLVIFIAVPVLAFATLLIGGRSIVTSILAGRMLRGDFSPGDEVEVDGVRGRIETIRLITTCIDDGKQWISVPNRRFAEGNVIKRKI
ncbi:MAG: mechanosensitive ion channel family protein [Opitutales bacterium]|nr:mechanosensitive ion channel family protein [Opitutales bacterium]